MSLSVRLAPRQYQAPNINKEMDEKNNYRLEMSREPVLCSHLRKVSVKRVCYLIFCTSPIVPNLMTEAVRRWQLKETFLPTGKCQASHSSSPLRRSRLPGQAHLPSARMAAGGECTHPSKWWQRARMLLSLKQRGYAPRGVVEAPSDCWHPRAACRHHTARVRETPRPLCTDCREGLHQRKRVAATPLRREATGDRRQAAGGRRQAAGGRRQRLAHAEACCSAAVQPLASRLSGEGRHRTVKRQGHEQRGRRQAQGTATR